MNNCFFKIGDETWFKEQLYDDIAQIFLVDEILYNNKTAYQHVNIFSNKKFGKILSLDGIVQLTEFDEYIYHEAMAHAPILLSGGNIKKVCIVGGGDGGVLREVVKYKFISKITLIEIDKEIVEISKNILPNINNGAYNDERVDVIFEDAYKFFSENRKDVYDVIIIDSTDPIDFTQVLYSSKFYQLVYDALSEDGVAIFQSGSILMQDDEYLTGYKNLKRYFKNIDLFKITNATYYGGEFCLLLVSKKTKIVSLKSLSEQYINSNLNTKWYSPQKHLSVVINSPIIIDNLIT